jgi:hypothetical protein
MDEKGLDQILVENFNFEYIERHGGVLLKLTPKTEFGLLMVNADSLPNMWLEDYNYWTTGFQPLYQFFDDFYDIKRMLIRRIIINKFNEYLK